MDAENKTDIIRLEFIEKIGMIAQNDGLPRIAGRIMGIFVFDGRDYSFSELARVLQVSRGSVSTNTKLLERLGVLERLSKPGDRQDYFKLADNPYEVTLRLAIERQHKASEAIQKTIDQLPSTQKKQRDRLIDYRSFYDAVAEGITHAMHEL